jgi:uncharacterized protein (TIGR01777 family)
MNVTVFERSILIARPAGEAYAWHMRPGAFARLQPPWERVELLGVHPGVRDGTRVRVRSRVGPLHFNWEVEHRDCEEGRGFCDMMRSGPFAHWEHRHIFTPIQSGRCRLTDRITYRLPGGAAGRIFAGRFVYAKLDRIFAYRQAVTKADLEMAQADTRPLTVLITGASGLMGRALTPFLETQGHRVLQLVRRPPATATEIFWDPGKGKLDARQLEGIDAVVHLAGENIAEGRWTTARRAALRESRLAGTRTLVAALGQMHRRPGVLLSASALGIYGDSGQEIMTEESRSGEGFLAALCRDWEAELSPARMAGMRSVALRMGLVLTPAGGALAKMLPAFRAGVGGRLGSGCQWLGWIAMDDLLGAVHHVLHNPECDGPVNVVAPGAVTNADFTTTLGRVLRRPVMLPVPALALRALFGDMADEALLASTRAVPAQLQRSGYAFRFPELEPALRHVLGKAGPA